tara:strand:- start:466 stop:861 length:396 start_codon:yes stop_codon:yes gene_type:complete
MSQKDNIVNVRLKKQGKKLIPASPFETSQYNSFIDTLEEDQVIEVFFEAHKDDGTNAQLAKIHTCIRKLALETGYTFEQMKLEIKKRSGLIYGNLNSSEGYAKSLADCSKEELSLVIEALNEAGEMVNLSF